MLGGLELLQSPGGADRDVKDIPLGPEGGVPGWKFIFGIKVSSIFRCLFWNGNELNFLFYNPALLIYFIKIYCSADFAIEI